MRGIPLTIWLIAVLLAGCGDSCCPDPKDHLCYFDLVDGGADSSFPPPSQFEQGNCVIARTGGAHSDACPDDPYEPNDDFVTALIPATPECAGTSKDATIAYGDIDVFRTGTCENAASSPGFGKSLTPWAQSDGDVHLCIFPTCNDGSTRMLGCLATDNDVVATSDMKTQDQNLATSTLGFHGCCREGPGRITAVLDCPLQSTKVDTFIWVEALGGVQCTPYSVKYQIE